jgi:hypothetical protein
MNQVGILVTSGGSHPPEKWAAASAGQIIQIAAEAAGEQAIEGRRLELKMLDILERHHGLVQDEEKQGLEKFGVDRYSHPIDVKERVDSAFDEILAASKGTIFEKHFMQENVQEHVKEVLRKDMTTEVEIERSWHKSRAEH